MKADLQSNCNGDQLIHLRCKHEYEDLSGRFRLRLRSYDRQFSNIYAVRISEARRRTEKIAQMKWGKWYLLRFGFRYPSCMRSHLAKQYFLLIPLGKPVHKLTDLNGMRGEKCVIMGTLYKHQELKPSILQEVSKQVLCERLINYVYGSAVSLFWLLSVSFHSTKQFPLQLAHISCPIKTS